MRHIVQALVFIASATAFNACKKSENNGTAECFEGTATIRQITAMPALVKVTGTIYGIYLVEQGTIDTKLLPCNLPMEFLQNDLAVTISGHVKETPQGAGPCCAYNFFITKIEK